MADWISWTPYYSVHVEQIDDQHRELLKRFNDLLEAMWDGKGKEAVGSSLQFLADYTIYHFGAEKHLMIQHDYPNYGTHKSIHDGFVKEVREFLAKCATEDVGTGVVVGVAIKLGDWVRDHIRRMDVQFGEFLKSRL
ncbi:MAG: bacteriohemerythrin [Desulfomonile sp.]|nr:bacteriohemerythrin [Desulfomonile sp.]